MQEKYLPTEIEQAAQAHWNTTQAFRAVEDPGFSNFRIAQIYRDNSIWKTTAHGDAS